MYTESSSHRSFRQNWHWSLKKKSVTCNLRYRECFGTHIICSHVYVYMDYKTDYLLVQVIRILNTNKWHHNYTEVRCDFLKILRPINREWNKYFKKIYKKNLHQFCIQLTDSLWLHPGWQQTQSPPALRGCVRWGRGQTCPSSGRGGGCGGGTPPQTAAVWSSWTVSLSTGRT